MNNIIDGGRSIASTGSLKKGQTTPGPAAGFSESLRHAVIDVTQQQQLADKKALQAVQPGQSGSLHEAMIALEKADISFRTMLQVRNKLIEAYQEIMRIQV